MERKGSDINSFQGDPRVGVGEVFSFPWSIPKEEGCVPKRRGSREISAQSPGSSLLELPDVPVFSGLRGRMHAGAQLRFQEDFGVSRSTFKVNGPSQHCRGWTEPDFLAAGSWPVSRRELQPAFFLKSWSWE